MVERLAEHSDFGYVMVRPDALELGLDEPIIARIEAAGLVIAKRKLAAITGDQVDGLYPDLHGVHYYDSMKASMVGRKAMSLLITGEPDVGQRLRAVKGYNADVAGTVRGDFSGGHLLDEELRARYVTGTLTDEDRETRAWKMVLQDNRMHSEQTAGEGARTVQLMFLMEELLETADRYPLLAGFLEGNR